MDNTLEYARRLWYSPLERDRRKQTEILYNIYIQNWKTILIRHLRTIYSEQLVEQLIPKAVTSLNLLKWVVDELSQIYVEPPKRSIKNENTSEATQLIEWFENKGRLDLALDRACRLCFALREIVLRPRPSKDGVSLEVILPHLVTVQHDENDFTKIKMIVLQQSPNTKHVWTKDFLYVCDNSFCLVEKTINNFGMIPFIVAHASYPTQTFWHTSEAYGLRDLTLSVATGLTDHAHLRHLQSFKQVWVKADEVSEIYQQIVLDPSAILPLRGNASIGTLDLTTDLGKHLDSCLLEAEAGVALWGLRSEQIRGKMEAASGYALSLKMQNQIKVWKKQRRVWEVWEKEIFQLSYRLLFYKQPSMELEVDFHPILEVENNV